MTERKNGGRVLTTLESIHAAAKAEFLRKGFKSASLRSIVKQVGMTTGAFYGYYDSKEALFEALVGEHYDYFMNRFKAAQQMFTEIPPEQQPECLASVSGDCMFDMLHYARFAGMIDEMVEIETKATHDYLTVLEQLGRPAPPIDPKLEHILITGMFNAFFELIIHEMPINEAESYLREMRAFYTAGWMEIMGQ